MRLQTTTGGQTTSTTPQTRYLPTQWPDAVALREAIQNPQVVLGDRELRASEILCDRRGLPITYAGRCAVVFRLRTLGGENWALRCFTQGVDAQERRERYTAIARRLESLPDCFVPFRYLDEGVKVFGQWFPCVAMRWAQGETLGRFVEQHAADPASLRRLSATLADLRHRLESAGIAHGDWQHDNLLVSEGGRRITLVDYDGMYVPELAGRVSAEVGHPNYQHPARTAAHYAPGMDRFAHLVLQTGLLALSHEPSLWTRFSDGESLLFKRHDFLAPAGSPVFDAVRGVAKRDKHLAGCLDRLQTLCMDGTGAAALTMPESVPALPQDYHAGALKRWRAARPHARGAERQAGAGVSYAERVKSAEAMRFERRLLWALRGTLAAVLSALLATTGSVFASVMVTVVTYWFLLAAGYLLWPRVRIESALLRDLQRTRAELRQCSRMDSVQDFVLYELSKVPVERSFLLGNIRHDTPARLRGMGLMTAADLQNRTGLFDIEPDEWNTLNKWVFRLQGAAARRYHKLADHQKPQPAEVAGREQEKAGLRKRLIELEREKAKFPNPSWDRFRARFWGNKPHGTLPI